MEADWSVACGADDPTVVIPWSSEQESVRYIDLRAAPDNIDQIQEAARYPALAAALRSWNQPGSPVFTAKCDVWSYAADLFDAEELPGFQHAHASYIDLVAADLAVFSNFAACEQRLRSWTNHARSIELPPARCEWTLRRASFLSAGEIAGFATTLYVWGYGASPSAAADAWSAALVALIEPVLLPANS